MNKWPWVARLVWDPVEALDLTDNEGKADHGKILPAILLFSAIVYQAISRQYPWYALLALGSLAYGYGAWRTFLKSKSVTGTITDKRELIEKRDVKIEHKIVENRNSDEGFEPTQEEA